MLGRNKATTPPPTPTLQFNSPGFYEALLYLLFPWGQLWGSPKDADREGGEVSPWSLLETLAGDFANHRASAAQLGHGALPVTPCRCKPARQG